jgi:CBS domain-containing protein
MHPEVRSDKPGQCPKCGMALKPASLSDERKKQTPGYPQDDMMMMIVDDEMAKPENYGLAPGWSASLQGMMNLIRVLPPDKYEEVIKRVREGRVEKPAAPAHKHE